VRLAELEERDGRALVEDERLVRGGVAARRFAVDVSTDICAVKDIFNGGRGRAGHERQNCGEREHTQTSETNGHESPPGCEPMQ
jgi:hypothetical protein